MKVTTLKKRWLHFHAKQVPHPGIAKTKHFSDTFQKLHALSDRVDIWVSKQRDGRLIILGKVHHSLAVRRCRCACFIITVKMLRANLQRPSSLRVRKTRCKLDEFFKRKGFAFTTNTDYWCSISAHINYVHCPPRCKIDFKDVFAATSS